ncbi:hypothetical protein EI94DRAFT_1070490 [Lactarius quietus]|nr:hypothetical protein EI94DRAFT_1070490 [Lactarius quietus]
MHEDTTKVKMFKRDQLAHVRAERDVLTESTSPWVVQLYYSFQDPLYLYLIMEFLPDGDIMTLLMNYDVFFRGKDDVLIDKNGHLKLSNFGPSTGMHARTDAAYYTRLIEQ